MNDFLDFWFEEGERFWFNCTSEDDDCIRMHFGHLLETYKEVSPSKDFPGHLVLLAKILVTDQLPRHMFRNQREIHKIYQDDALTYATDLIDHPKFKKLSPQQRMFALLPYRHTFDEEPIRYVIGLVKGWIKHEGSSKYYQRFLRASFISLGKIINKKLKFASSENILFENELDTVLEYNPENWPRSAVVLKRNKLTAFRDSMQLLKKQPGCSKKLVLSLSGGVDSMVVSYLLKNYTTVSFTAVHINYKQRSESDLEAEFVRSWCAQTKIPLLIRTIDEIKKDDTSREIYETVTKEIRFDAYKQLSQETNCCPLIPVPVSSTDQSYVVLGHHIDDSFENFITNIRKGINQSNLKGMDIFKEVSGVVLFRPLLNATKKEILEFAHEHFIPYLKDTTNPKSQRGYIRNKVAPVLGSEIVKGSIRLAEEHTELYNTVINSLAKPYVSTICELKPGYFRVIIHPETPRTEIFWKYVIYKLIQKVEMSESRKLNYPTNRSIRAFVEKLNSLTIKNPGNKILLPRKFSFTAGIAISGSFLIIS